MVTAEQLRTAFMLERAPRATLHDYVRPYVDIFTTVPNAKKILEVGVGQGRGLVGWKSLLAEIPDSRLLGVDKRPADQLNLVEGAQDVEIIQMDSLRSAVNVAVGGGWDLIIDDADHRPNYQWETFGNLKGCFTGVYVIENIFGSQNENILRRRLSSIGYGADLVSTYDSRFKSAKVQANGVEVIDKFMMMVIKQKQEV